MSFILKIAADLKETSSVLAGILPFVPVHCGRKSHGNKDTARDLVTCCTTRGRTNISRG